MFQSALLFFRKRGVVLRKRNSRVEIYFSKDELEALTKKVRRAGLSREGFCRRILNGAEVKEAPPADLPMLIRELRQVGCKLDSLLKRADAVGLPEAYQLREALEDNRAVEKLVVDTYTSSSD